MPTPGGAWPGPGALWPAAEVQTDTWMAATGEVPAALRLPRASLDTLLRLTLARHAEGGAPDELLLAHAPLVLQPQGTGLVALAGPVSTQPLRALASPRAGAPAAPAPDGLVLLALAPAGSPQPLGDAGWEAWLLQHAPGFRLATAAVNPALVLLWLRMDGQGALMFRHGRRPETPHASRWVPVPHLQLPGGGMQGVNFSGDAALAHQTRPAMPGTDADADAYGPGSRDSRQAAAFGVAGLHRLQHSHIVLVGAGRTGSVLAHGLVRLGVRQLSVIEPDHMEPHNEDGDFAPLHEGRPKLEALSRFVRGLQRPGAVLDLNVLPVASPAAGRLIGQADAVVVCVDNDAARLQANAWALAHNRCLLAVATTVHEHGAEADLRLLPAGTGCLACVGGYAQATDLLQQLAQPGAVPTPADFTQQRRGSLRSWSALAAHLGQRLLEQHLLRPGGGALFRQLLEMPQGGLDVRDWRPADPARLRGCPYCRQLQGAGHAAVTPQRLLALTVAWLAAQGLR